MRHSCIATRVRLACVRHAASVRSEPGSNSQVSLGRSLKAPKSWHRSIALLRPELTRQFLPRCASNSTTKLRRRLRIPSSSLQCQRASSETTLTPGSPEGAALISLDPRQVNSDSLCSPQKSALATDAHGRLSSRRCRWRSRGGRPRERGSALDRKRPRSCQAPSADAGPARLTRAQ